MRKNKKEVLIEPTLYLFIYGKIREKANRGIFISHSEVITILRRRLHKIPRRLHYIILKEMEQLKWIKKKSTSSYELLVGDIDKSLRENFFILDNTN